MQRGGNGIFLALSRPGEGSKRLRYANQMVALGWERGGVGTLPSRLPPPLTPTLSTCIRRRPVIEGHCVCVFFNGFIGPTFKWFVYIHSSQHRDSVKDMFFFNINTLLWQCLNQWSMESVHGYVYCVSIKSFMHFRTLNSFSYADFMSGKKVMNLITGQKIILVSSIHFNVIVEF